MRISRIKQYLKEYGLYGIFFGLTRWTKHTILYKYFNLILAYINQKRGHAPDHYQKVVLFNTSIESKNAGDYIVMDYITKILDENLKSEFIHIPTHIEPTKEQLKQFNKNNYKILCGTNILWSKLEKYYQWMFPTEFRCYQNTILLGVGWNVYSDKISSFTKWFYRIMLNKDSIHSVRDEYAANMLRSCGIENVVNTGCPTMWKLTSEFCKKIPKTKAENVIITITDYRRDYENDKLLIQIAKKHYKKVYLWLQGSNDLPYLNELEEQDGIITVDSKLEEYDKLLASNEDIDYIGTRLHAGIRALNYGRRSMILIIDNRAREIVSDTNLPGIERENIKTRLEPLILEERETIINLPWENIEAWKKQFSRKKDC